MTADGKTTLSRRTLVGAAGVAAAGAVTGLAPSIAKEKQEMTMQEIENPAEKYPKPPFKKQIAAVARTGKQDGSPPDHGETATRGPGRLAGRKALITGGDSGMGRAAAIAFAREGADVAINYFPTEEPDAQEVIELIKAEGRKGVAMPGDLRDEEFCQEAGARGGRRSWRPGHPGQQRRPAAGARFDPRHFDRGF